MKRIIVVALAALFSLAIISNPAMSGDLDDGISKYKDDGISKYDDMGKADQNVKFIVMNAKSKAAMLKGDSDTKAEDNANATINSVILGAGSKIKGDIIIIDQSTGDKTNVAQ